VDWSDRRSLPDCADLVDFQVDHRVAEDNHDESKRKEEAYRRTA
jgi:hypothetical protein